MSDISKAEAKEPQPSSGTEDAQLIGMYQSGDREAYIYLVERHTSYVYHLCRQFLGNPHDAEDLSQAVWILVGKRLQNFKYSEEGKFKWWLGRVTFNECVTARRNRKRNLRDGKIGYGGEVAFDQSLANEPSPSDQLIQVETVAILRRSMDELPADQRAVISHRIDDGMTFAEIAEKLQIPLGTALSRFRLGISKLKTLLEQRQSPRVPAEPPQT